MKKTLLILFALLFSILVFTSCDMLGDIEMSNEDLGIPCTHKYMKEVTAPSCTASGYTTYTCKYCQDSYVTDEIAPIPHDYKGATCTEQGVCAVCNTKGGDPLGHELITDFGGPAPTCTESGYISTTTCTRCDYLDRDIVPATGHNYEDGVCKNCGDKEPDDHTHNWIAPTCTADGYCSICNAPGEGATGHSFVAPTCTADGYCSICNAIGEGATGHSYDNGACKNCGEADPNAGGTQYEDVSYSLNISDLEVGTSSEDSINSKFTIVAGTEIRNRNKSYTDPDTGEVTSYSRSVKIGSSSAAIKVSVPGSGRLTFYVQNGSSGAATQFVKIISPDGTASQIEFAGTDESSPVVRITVDVTEGEWTIARVSGTIDIFMLELSCQVEKSEESGFEIVSEGTVDYLVGDALDFSGLRINSVYLNGKTEPLTLDDVTIDASEVNMLAAGVYNVYVQYKEYDKQVYQVNVYEPESIELDFDAVEKLAENSAAGNGVYFNYSFKEVYSVGDELDLSGLCVTVCAKLNGNVKKFMVNNYTVDGFSSDTAGKKTLTVTFNYASESVAAYVSVDVVDAELSLVGNVYQAKVDKAYTGAIGAVVDGYNMFTTIQGALDFLAKADAATKKLIVVESGLYEEKLEITIPNLTIRGAGADATIIERDSLYGISDGSGFVHVTDSTATVAIRDNATGVTLEDLTVSNKYNSKEYFDEVFGPGYGEHRALALLVQSDSFIMRNAKLLGYQDTVELFTGRQYFYNVYIQGLTDFIFGTNNTTLFEECTIHSISSGKTDGGYITAFKGSNKGAGDSIVYGAIFYKCDFTADADVVENANTAIGRPWGAYAAVALINCDIDGHVSTKGFSGSSKNQRYVSMNAKPTDSTVQFREYGNTGAGAITEEVAGMKFLTAEEAALYVDIAVIFGKTNGNVSYLDAWDPSSTEIAVDDRTYYNFDQSENNTGTSYTFDIETPSFTGSTITFGDLLISAENGKVAWNQNANALNMKQGAFIKFSVKAGTEVTVVTYPNYNYFTLNGAGTSSANMLTQHYADDTEVVLLSTGDLYLYQIIINPDEAAPEAPTLNEIKLEGFNTSYIVGDDLTLDGVFVKAYYSDSSIVTVSDYTLDSSAVVNTAAGQYDVIFSYGGKTVTVTVTYEDPNADPAITQNTVLSFASEDDYNAVVNNKRVTLDGNFRVNGSEYQVNGTVSFMVKAGTLVKVIPYANTSYVSYTIGKQGAEGLETLNSNSEYFATEDCTVVYTGLSNNYLVAIEIICPVSEGKYVFGGSSEEGDVNGILESTANISITGTCKNHSGGAQLGQDSEISFITPAFATVTIKGFDTSYGQLSVLVGDALVEMDSSACYVFSTTAPTRVVIKALNVGTEESPAYNKSYITYINVAVMDAIEESLTVNFGSSGNYKESGIDFSGIEIADNGGNNSQIKNGSFSFAVKVGATVVVNGYSGYTAYSFSDGTTTHESITDSYFEYVAFENKVITITPTSGNNYFYSISITYLVVVEKENVEVTFGTDGNYGSAPASVDLSNIQIGDNGSDNSQVKNGYITITVLEGGKLTINGYSGYTGYTIDDGIGTSVDVTDSEYNYVAESDVTVTITPTTGNNYFYSIYVTY